MKSRKGLGQGQGQFNERKDYNCQYCGKTCHSKNSLVNHERQCKENPNKQIIKHEGDHFKKWRDEHRAWNKGLSKETDERVAKNAKAVSEGLKNSPKHKNLGKASTPEKELERRRKISETGKKNPKMGGKRHGSGRGKKGWYKGYFCDSTYELVFIIFCLDHNIKIERNKKGYPYIFNNKNHTYYPDFIIGNSYVEIKNFHSAKTDAKLLSVTDKKIICLYPKDLKHIFNYILDKYNKTEERYTDLYDIYTKNDFNKLKEEKEKKKLIRKLLRIIKKYIKNKNPKKYRSKEEIIEERLLNDERYKQATIDGKIDKNGNINANKNTNQEWDRRKTLIFNSGIDLLQYGWLAKLINATGLTKKQIYHTIEYFKIQTYRRKQYSTGKRYGFNS